MRRTSSRRGASSVSPWLATPPERATTSSSEQSYVLQSIERACLFGYSPGAKKLVVYIDSQNYAHEAGAYPYIVALQNGDLVLAFQKASNCSRYRFHWDADANWFGYSDLGTGWPSVSKDKQ